MSKQGLRELPVYLIYILLFLVTVNNPFFWDTIQLGSKHATWFYANGYSSLRLPNEIDSGHLPSFGVYLSIVWKQFGRTLVFSHLAVLPFVLLNVFLILRLSNIMCGEKWYPYMALIPALDPTLLAQSTLVSPDIILVTFFLLAVYSFISNKYWLLSISVAGLVLISMRGMMCAAAIFIAGMFMLINKELNAGTRLKMLRKFLLSFVPGVFIAVTFLLWHYLSAGWIGFHKEMPWYSFFKPASFKEIIRNVLIYGWRIIDFGRIFLWVPGLVLIFLFLKRKLSASHEIKFLAVLLICLLAIFGFTAIFFKNLSGHRYFLPVYLTFSFVAIALMLRLFSNQSRIRIFLILVASALLTGNLWVYPDTIAKGWDSSLAYLPYFSLRSEMMNYMSEGKIGYDETATGFPNEDKFDYVSLTGNKTSFASRDLTYNRYILWSNVYNDFSDRELDSLKKWDVLHSVNKCQVRMILYRNPSITN